MLILLSVNCGYSKFPVTYYSSIRYYSKHALDKIKVKLGIRVKCCLQLDWKRPKREDILICECQGGEGGTAHLHIHCPHLRVRNSAPISKEKCFNFTTFLPDGGQCPSVIFPKISKANFSIHSHTL